MSRQAQKRQTDFQIISGWIPEGSRVLDVGCGRGILLENLIRSRSVNGLGVDTSLSKIQSCIRRGVPAYHGEAETLLNEFPDNFFDWVILSRTIQELDQPGKLIDAALKVSRHLAVGFVNYGYWLNRLSHVLEGTRPSNEVYPNPWEASHPIIPVTVKGFQDFAKARQLRIADAVFLRGDWKRQTRWYPNLFAGYALFHLTTP